MAIKKVMVGSLGPFLYDDSKVIADASFGGASYGGVVTTGNISSIGGSVFVGGADGSVTIITAIRDNSGTIEYKHRTLTFNDGVLSTIGTESDWVST